jgi:hypothetical protein
MVRTILTPEQRDICLSIPEAYIGKPVEIIFLALDELDGHPEKTMGDFFGVLPGDTYLQLKKHTEQARAEWNRDF